MINCFINKKGRRFYATTYCGMLISMIKSMTGFGRAQQIIDGMSISVEIKSVNHRYFDFSSRVPRVYGFLEEKLKSYIQTRVARGKIECFVLVEALEIEDCEED